MSFQNSAWNISTLSLVILAASVSAPVRSIRSFDRHLLHQPRTNTVTASRAFAVPEFGTVCLLALLPVLTIVHLKPNFTYFTPSNQTTAPWTCFNEIWRYISFLFVFVLCMYLRYRTENNRQTDRQTNAAENQIPATIVDEVIVEKTRLLYKTDKSTAKRRGR